MAQDGPVFNRDEFMAIFSGDEELVREVLAGFVTHCDELFAQMNAAAASGDRQALVFASHKLKGSAANVRAPLLSAAAAQLEKALADGSLRIAPPLLGEVSDCYREFKREVGTTFPGLLPGE